MWRAIVLWPVLVTVAGLGLNAAGQNPPVSEQTEADEPPASTQPAPPATHRTPTQARIIEGLLRDRDKPKWILPREPEPVVGADVATSQPADGQGAAVLLPDGTMLVERPGRLVWENERPNFVFYSDAGVSKLQTMEILPNGFREALERQAQFGNTEFVISGQVTRYRNRNYLLLTKVLQRVRHGNLSP